MGPHTKGGANYLGNIGTTADSTSTDLARVGVFNSRSTQGIQITDIKDGSSNTAMFSETVRSTITGSSQYNTNPTAIFLLPNTDSGWNLYQMPYGPANSPNGKTHCNDYSYGPTNIITYRGEEYYRGLVEMQNYTHTMPPNSPDHDCGEDTLYVAAHMAARSNHTGGANFCFADGSLHFITNTVNFTLYQAMGTRSGSDIVDGSAF